MAYTKIPRSKINPKIHFLNVKIQHGNFFEVKKVLWYNAFLKLKDCSTNINHLIFSPTFIFYHFCRKKVFGIKFHIIEHFKSLITFQVYC